MKNYDLIYYWQNYLMNEDNIRIIPDAYVLKFSLINSYSRDFFCNWYSFKSPYELIGFIKYVVIPSTYITKIFGKDEDTIFLDALDQYETIDLIEESNSSNKLNIIREINQAYELLENIKSKFTMAKIKRYVNGISKKDDIFFGIINKLEVFEDVNKIGKELVEEFEKENMLDQLEGYMDLNKNQILDMFEGIDKNPFMLKRLSTYLSTTLAY